MTMQSDFPDVESRLRAQEAMTTMLHARLFEIKQDNAEIKATIQEIKRNNAEIKNMLATIIAKIG